MNVHNGGSSVLVDAYPERDDHLWNCPGARGRLPCKCKELEGGMNRGVAHAIALAESWHEMGITFKMGGKLYPPGSMPPLDAMLHFAED